MKNSRKITAILQQIEKQQKALAQTVKTTATSKATKVVNKIPVDTINQTQFLYKTLVNILKTIFHYWFNRFYKNWFFRLLVTIFNYLLWPVTKIVLLLNYYKMLRTFLILVALIFGLKIDFDHLDLSLTALTSFMWPIWDKFLDLLISYLSKLTQWLYRIQVGSRLNDITIVPDKEVVHIDNKLPNNSTSYYFDTDIESDEYKYNQYLVQKEQYKNELFRALNINDQPDQHWYNNKNILIGIGCAVGLLICGGIYYYYFFDKSNTDPKPMSKDEIRELYEEGIEMKDARTTLDTSEAGPSNLPTDEARSAWENRYSPTNELSSDDKTFKNTLFPYHDQSNNWTEGNNSPVSESGSSSSVETIKATTAPSSPEVSSSNVTSPLNPKAKEFQPSSRS